MVICNQQIPSNDKSIAMRFGLRPWIFQISLPVFLCISMILGCGGGTGDRPDIGTVVGKVTLDGSPLADAEVTFQPDSGRPSRGVTGADGRYKLLYVEGVEGAKVGENTVLISKLDQKFDASGELISSKETISAEYNKESKLKVTVEEGNNTMDFDLESK